MFKVFQQTISKPILINGIGLHKGINVSMKLIPAEADYGMYEDGVGTAADPLTNFDPQPFPLTGASFAGQVDFVRNDGLGALDGRYSIDFVADAEGQAGFNIPQGAVAPASPTVGSLWFDTQNLQLMVYINDGNSLQWVSAS